MIGACGSEEEPAPVTPGIARPTGHPPLSSDEIETELLDGLDESLAMAQGQLDQDFPLAPLTPLDEQADPSATSSTRASIAVEELATSGGKYEPCERASVRACTACGTHTHSTGI